MKRLLSRIITPSSWMRGEKYSKIVDDWFYEALKNPVFTEIGPHTCKLNGVEVWIANRYYAGPALYGGSSPKGICSTYIAKKLYKLVDAKQLEITNKKSQEWLAKNQPTIQKIEQKELHKLPPKVVKAPETLFEAVKTSNEKPKTRSYCTVKD